MRADWLLIGLGVVFLLLAVPAVLSGYFPAGIQYVLAAGVALIAVDLVKRTRRR